MCNLPLILCSIRRYLGDTGRREKSETGSNIMFTQSGGLTP
ncbi:unnamed protein product [Staurois parvus]|uniref:Uncharacterized protein n=1 Tax=Staurois parvus TaxID=386267 RepID=A0ABN9DSH6_9NEOB|nr:unnamed protein product [Staurois parvus]